MAFTIGANGGWGSEVEVRGSGPISPNKIHSGLTLNVFAYLAASSGSIPRLPFS